MHERASNSLKLKDSKINIIKLKRSFAAFALLVCPGDDIALIAAQVNTVTHAEMPDVAMIHQAPRVKKYFELEEMRLD